MLSFKNLIIWRVGRSIFPIGTIQFAMSSKKPAAGTVDQGINTKLNLVVKSGKFKIGMYHNKHSKILIFIINLGYKNTIKSLR